MPIYRTEGTLTGTIPLEGLADAQSYLTDDDMTNYLDDDLKGVVERIQWHLHSDGHAYHVEAVTTRELTVAELKELADWVSGQNSDGLGEGFEQQSFAETGGSSWYEDDDEDDDYMMISFDWKTNDSTFVRVV